VWVKRVWTYKEPEYFLSLEWSFGEVLRRRRKFDGVCSSQSLIFSLTMLSEIDAISDGLGSR